MKFLPEQVRLEMEGLFGCSFRDVRIHVAQPRSLSAYFAFANGSDLYFSQGLYQPHTAAGRMVLAHELAHVVQQRGGRLSGRAGLVDDAELEAEANWAAGRWAMGRRAFLAGREAPPAASPVWQAITEGQLNSSTVPGCTAQTILKKYSNPKKPGQSDIEKALGHCKDVPEFVDLAEKIRIADHFPSPSASPSPGQNIITQFLKSKTAGGGAAPTTATGAWGKPLTSSSSTASPAAMVVAVTAALTPQSVKSKPGMQSAATLNQDWNALSSILQLSVRPPSVTDFAKGAKIPTSPQTTEILISMTASGVVYQFVLHYHPAPINQNFLHFKNNPEASINYKVSWDHWLLKELGITGPNDMV